MKDLVFCILSLHFLKKFLFAYKFFVDEENGKSKSLRKWHNNLGQSWLYVDVSLNLRKWQNNLGQRYDCLTLSFFQVFFLSTDRNIQHHIGSISSNLFFVCFWRFKCTDWSTSMCNTKVPSTCRVCYFVFFVWRENNYTRQLETSSVNKTKQIQQRKRLFLCSSSDLVVEGVQRSSRYSRHHRWSGKRNVIFNPDTGVFITGTFARPKPSVGLQRSRNYTCSKNDVVIEGYKSNTLKSNSFTSFCPSAETVSVTPFFLFPS